MSEAIGGRSFEEQLRAVILDPLGVHHEFNSGAHGRKLDFGLIEPDSELFETWVGAHVQDIRADSEPPAAIADVATGTTELVRQVAGSLGVLALFTHKPSEHAKSVALSPESVALVSGLSPDARILVIDDVGTTGGTALTAVESLRAAGAQNVAVSVTWQRTPSLGILAAARVPYSAIISSGLPTFTPRACQESGYCKADWTLVTRPAASQT